VATAANVAPAAKPKIALLSAIIRAFPYMGLAYVIFMGAIETSLGAVYAVAAVAVAGALALLLARNPKVTVQVPALASLRATVEAWPGEIVAVSAALLALGFGLIGWAGWHATHDQSLSWMAILLLLLALFSLIRASYQRPEAAQA
jgi:hypothetical protein